MDPFSKLPPLVQEGIFIHIESEASIMQLIRASPVMGSLFIARKTRIMQRILMNLLAGDSNGRILQDALAILYFPRAETSSISSIHYHIEQWAVHEFNDPFSNPGAIQSLWHLFSRLVIFVEDYLSKATDPFPPRAYLALPGLRFRGKSVDIKPVAFTLLNGTERCRLLQAFLRYEMLCKVYHPRVWSSIKQSSASLVKFMHETLKPAEHKALYCVYEYFKGMYGAIFAHCQDSWLPDRPVEPTKATRHQHGLLYPDTVYFSARDYLRTMDRDIRREDLVVDFLPCLGLDYLTYLLGRLSLDKPQQYRQYLKWWLRSVLKPLRQNHTPWILMRHFSRHQQSATYDPSVYYRGLHQESPFRPVSMIQRNLEWGRTAWQERKARQSKTHNQQLRIYRQRAWAFFDDARLYPDDIMSHFPTMDDLDEQDQIAGEIIPLSYHRDRRRSQKWQDYYSGRTLDSPVNDEEEDKEMEMTDGKQEYHLVRFFEKPVLGEIAGPD